MMDTRDFSSADHMRWHLGCVVRLTDIALERGYSLGALRESDATALRAQAAVLVAQGRAIWREPRQ